MAIACRNRLLVISMGIGDSNGVVGVGVGVGIKLLSHSNDVQAKTQVKRTIASPEISYLCQLS